MVTEDYLHMCISVNLIILIAPTMRSKLESKQLCRYFAENFVLPPFSHPLSHIGHSGPNLNPEPTAGRKTFEKMGICNGTFNAKTLNSE